MNLNAATGILQGDVTGDGTADFALKLDGVTLLMAGEQHLLMRFADGAAALVQLRDGYGRSPGTLCPIESTAVSAQPYDEQSAGGLLQPAISAQASAAI